MILQSRKWRLLLRVITLVVTSSLMLAFAAPASYALQDDRPKLISRAEQLFDKEKPVDGTYVYTSALPDLAHMVTTRGIGTTYYWIPLARFGNKLLVRAEGDSFLQAYYKAADLNLDSGPREGTFYGKITSLTSQADWERLAGRLDSAGVKIDNEQTMVLLQGEAPQTYRPMVPVVGVLAAFWALALVGLLRIVRGGSRRKLRRA
ncbi:MAG: hypothetical protein ACJ78Q_06105 [Chloroflexia bacterium]